MMTKLSDTARVILRHAAQHPDSLAEAPASLPAAARIAVIRSMLKHGLLEEVPAPREHADLAWRKDDNGEPIALRITEAGLRAVGIEPAPPEDEVARRSEPERDLHTAGQGDSQAAFGSRASWGVTTAERRSPLRRPLWPRVGRRTARRRERPWPGLGSRQPCVRAPARAASRAT